LNYICKQQNTQQQSSNKYEQRLFSALLLAYAKIENSVYSAKHIVGGNFACYVAGVVDVITQNGRDESSPVIFLEYARHGVFFCSCCNLLSDE
jgi:hypothetical protein